MRSAQSYPLDPTVVRPEKLRLRHQRPMRKRIRNSVSAGPTMTTFQRCNRTPHVPTITTFQRCNRTHHVRTIPDEKSPIYRPCSASADVSSISSSTDSAEHDEHTTAATLQRIMHAKHRVIRRAREQMIKLVNNDLAPQEDHTGTRPFQTNQNANKLNYSPIDYDSDRQQSIGEKLCYEDDILYRLDEHPDRTARDKYGFDGRVPLNTDRKPNETYADDGRALNAKKDSKNHYSEYSPEIHGERYSPDGINYSLINRQFTRKTNKFFVPFTNNNAMDGEPIPKTTFDGKEKYTENIVTKKEEKAVEKDISKPEQRGFYARTEEDSARHGLQRAIPLVKPSDTSKLQPPVKTFYENPYLKDTSCGPTLTLPIGTENTSSIVPVLLSRSTNTSPVPQRAQSTSTIAAESLMSQNMTVAVGKDSAKRTLSLPRPFYAMQPLLFVLAMFTVSMSGAYVGVLVASASCDSCSGVECEPSILQWLFSSRRHIRAF